MRKTKVAHYLTSYSNPKLESMIDALAKARCDYIEDWLQTLLANELPPEIYLKAYGNEKCKKEMANWLTANGYCLHRSPYLTVTELRKGDVLIGRLTLC